MLPKKPRKKRLLVDVDDVLCDFKTPVIALIWKLFEIEVVLEELQHWDVFAVLTEEQRIILFRELSRPGYCSELLPSDGAQEAIESLRQVVDVVVATRPFISPTWVYERTNWLIEHFGFTEHTIINTAAKHMIRGDALLDDNPENVLAWREEHPQGAGLLWATPNTENMRQCDDFRVRTWPEVLILVKAL